MQSGEQAVGGGGVSEIGTLILWQEGRRKWNFCCCIYVQFPKS